MVHTQVSLEKLTTAVRYHYEARAQSMIFIMVCDVSKPSFDD